MIVLTVVLGVCALALVQDHPYPAVVLALLCVASASMANKRHP